MPANNAQWAFFLFFAGGALGGWMVLVLLAIEVVKGFRKAQ